MTKTWDQIDPPARPKMGIWGYVRVLVRGVPILTTLSMGLLVLLLVRLIERPICGMHRPVTPYITQGVCRIVLFFMRLPLSVQGVQMVGSGALVANHTSWLDIFVLNSRKNIYFVSKAEVANWPGIGWLARATGTLFIRRNRKDAAAQTKLFEQRLIQGHRLLFFPEGTSTDGRRILPFKTTLFAAFLTDRLRENLQLQAVSVIYHSPQGGDPRFYGWWGDMYFGPSMITMLAQPTHGHVEVIYHPPVKVAEFGNRKALAAHLEHQIRSSHQSGLGYASPIKSDS